LFVCLSVSNFAQNTSKRICVTFSGKAGNGPVNKMLVAIRITDSDTDPDSDPYRDSGKTCHCF